MLFKIPRFWKNASLALVGTLLYQLLPVAVLPIFTRLLDPGEIGVYFTWLGGVAILSVVLTFRLDMAVLQARNERQARRIIESVFLASMTFALIFTLFGLAFFWIYFEDEELKKYAFYIVSCGVASGFNSMNVMANALLIRGGNFKEQAAYRIFLGIAIVGSQGALIFVFQDSKALVLGQSIAIIAITAALLARTGFRYGNALKVGVKVRPGRIPKKYRPFINYSLPAALINMVAQYLPLFLVNGRLSASAAGYYGLTQRTLSAPLGLVGGSILSAFREESARRVRSGEGCFGSYIYTLKSLAYLGFVPFLILTIFGTEIFSFIFGKQWSEAGLLASYLAPMFFIRFVASPLSFMFFLLDKQKQDLVWQAVLFFITAGIFLVADNLRDAVLIYSTCSSFMYLINLYMSYKIAKMTWSSTSKNGNSA